MGKALDLTGQKIGKLLILQRVENNQYGQSMWLCQCDCGNKKIIRGSDLNKGKIVSCGCEKIKRCLEYSKQQKQKQEVGISTNAIDLTGQQFGYLTVLEIDKEFTLNQRNKSNTSKKCLYWKCKCQCGNIKTIAGDHLRRGEIKSCGCLQFSNGELKISQLLQENNIPFLKQVTFNDLKDERLLKFDFGILDSNNQIIKLIEFDGEQHFKAVDYFGGEEKFKILQKHDQMKNEYCKNHNIKLLRISKIEDITLENLLYNDTSLKNQVIDNALS